MPPSGALKQLKAPGNLLEISLAMLMNLSIELLKMPEHGELITEKMSSQRLPTISTLGLLISEESSLRDSELPQMAPSSSSERSLMT